MRVCSLTSITLFSSVGTTSIEATLFAKDSQTGTVTLNSTSCVKPSSLSVTVTVRA